MPSTRGQPRQEGQTGLDAVVGHGGVAADPHLEVLALHLGRDQRVELERGPQACALLSAHAARRGKVALQKQILYSDNINKTKE